MAKLHVFDMNGTLLKINSNVSWKEFLAKKQLAPANASEIAKDFADAYNAGKLDCEKFAAFQFEEFAGKSKPAIAKLAVAHFEEYIKPAVNQAAFDYVKKLIGNGESVAMLTTTNGIVAATVALHFGITDFIASEAEMNFDTFTGAPAGTFPSQYGKIFHIGRLCERYALCAADIAFYANSVNDIPLLQTVGTPVAVNPDAALREYAVSAKWQILDWTI